MFVQFGALRLPGNGSLGLDSVFGWISAVDSAAGGVHSQKIWSSSWLRRMVRTTVTLRPL